MIEHVFLGSQFIFLDPPAGQTAKIRVRPEGGEPTVHQVAKRSLFSRYRQSVTIDLAEEKREPPTLDGINLSQLLKQFTVVTDRKIYKPGQPIRVFAAGSGLGGEPLTVELKCNTRLVYSAEARLGSEGLHLLSLSDYDEGEYEVTARLTGQVSAQASCTFSIAQYTLSPLTALLKNFTFSQDQRLRFQLEIHLLGQPYEGSVRLDLYCGVCKGIIETQDLTSHEGALAGEFNLSGHGGPFHVDLVTPGGETARVDFPNTEADVRERLTLCGLGRTVQAGLLPDEGFQEVRGVYIGMEGARSTPLLLQEAVAGEAVLQVATAIALLQMVVIDPVSGDFTVIEHRDLQPGDTIRFPVPAPYRLFHAGAWLASGTPYEGWGTVVCPEAFFLKLEVPERASPGETVTVALESDHPCRCLLLAYDSRLTSENPIPRLARSIFEQWRGLSAWHEGDVRETLKSWLEPSMTGAELEELAPMEPRPAPMPKKAGRPPMAAAPGRVRAMLAMAGGVADFALASVSTPSAVAQEEATVTPSSPARMDFPELIHCELLDLEGRAEREVRLGDQIGQWTFTAYAFRQRDYRRATADLEASKELYVELDLPALLGPGDSTDAKVFYHTQGKAQLTVTSATERLQQEVEGSGQLTFPLGAPGELVALLVREGLRDELSRTVLPPGRVRVTHSDIRILEPGQKVGNGRVVVFPSLGYLLQESAEALLQYPFG